jgi:hypothetical protein
MGNEPAHNSTPDPFMSTATEQPMVLQRLMLRACRSAGGRLKMADSLGTRLTGREVLTRIFAAKAVLDRVLAADEKMVGVLLPPTAGAAVVNAAPVYLPVCASKLPPLMVPKSKVSVPVPMVAVVVACPVATSRWFWASVLTSTE